MSESSLGIYLVVMMLAMAVSMMLVPLMMHLAPKLGMLDEPDHRKVHVKPIPRVGGIGIVIGSLIPLFIWLPWTDGSISIFVGSLILLIFGTWDDVKELGHYVKFVGQFAAAIIVVYYGDIYVSHFPFMELEQLSEAIGRPFTVIAIVGMINAINHSDGLDGLAGGESLLSIGAIFYLAYIFGGEEVLIISAAAAGGIFGFLRYNSHPARVFMGDGGSQFIGFILSVIVIYITQDVNPVVSPALPALLVGLPVIDILAVFFLRAKHGLNLFKATSNHVHHRLLNLGFYHYESVVIIYSIQVMFVVCAVMFPYESDSLIMSIYVGTAIALFTVLTLAERSGVKVHAGEASRNVFFASLLERHKYLSELPFVLLSIGLSLFLLTAPLLSTEIPGDFGVSALILLVLLAVSLLLDTGRGYVYRLVMFVMIGFSVFLLSTYPSQSVLDGEYVVYGYFVLMGVLTFTCVRLSAKGGFHVSPLDYLLVVTVMISGLLPKAAIGMAGLSWILVQIIILFYACELIVQKKKSRIDMVTICALLALLLTSYRGLL